MEVSWGAASCGLSSRTSSVSVSSGSNADLSTAPGPWLVGPAQSVTRRTPLEVRDVGVEQLHVAHPLRTGRLPACVPRRIPHYSRRFQPLSGLLTEHQLQKPRHREAGTPHRREPLTRLPCSHVGQCSQGGQRCGQSALEVWQAKIRNRVTGWRRGAGRVNNGEAASASIQVLALGRQRAWP